MRALSLLAVAAMAFGLTALPAFADTGDHTAQDTADEKNCIPLQRIRNVDVLDHERILFRMRGGDHYLNTLPHPCPSLRRNKPIMYRTSLSSLCSLDSIRVLETYGGGYYPGASCGLGEFTPISDEELKALKDESRAEKQ